MNAAQQRIAFLTFLVVAALAALDQTIVATALPSIVQDIGSSSALSWIFSAYLISSTVAVPLYGKLADVLGIRRVLIGAVGVFAFGSLACGMSQNVDQLIIARGLQGIGGGGLLTLSMTAIIYAFPPDQRGKRQGMLGAAFGLATIVGPLLGGLASQYLNWRWNFLVNVPIGFVALCLLGKNFHLPKSPARPLPVDAAGALLLTGALVALMLSASPGAVVSSLPWASATSLATVAVVFTVLLLLVERKAPSPIIPLSLYATRDFAAACAINLLIGAALFAAVVFVPLYLQIERHLSPSAAGLQLMPLMAGITISSMVAGKQLDTMRRVNMLGMAGCFLMVVAMGALSYGLPAMNGGMLAATLGLFGVGTGIMFPLLSMVVQSVAPMPQIGSAMSNLNMCRTVGGAVGVSVLGGSLAAHMPLREPHAASSAALASLADLTFSATVQHVFLVTAGICAVAALLASLLRAASREAFMPVSPDAAGTRT